MRISSVYVVLMLLATLCALISTASYIRYLMEVNLEGVVNVEPKVKVVDIEINVDSKVGERSLNLGSVQIPAGGLIARGRLVGYEGNFTLILGGELLLESATHKYRILMPCLASIGEHCYRIMMLIPGYDVPLTVEGGDYNATFIVRWIAAGVGRFSLKLTLEFSEGSGDASISVVGVKPETTDDWIVAENSTRSYSMLVRSVNPASALVWVWILDSNNSLDSNILRFEVVDTSTGEVISEKSVEMFRDGAYWSVLVKVNIAALDRYVIRSSFGNVIMSSTLR